MDYVAVNVVGRGDDMPGTRYTQKPILSSYDEEEAQYTGYEDDDPHPHYGTNRVQFE